MARKAAAAEGVSAKFILMDAEEMKFEQTFDVVWSVESISPIRKEKFFAAAAQCLESGGTLAITDCLKGRLAEREHEKFIQPIEEGHARGTGRHGGLHGIAQIEPFAIAHTEILNRTVPKVGTSAWISSRIKRSGRSRRSMALSSRLLRAFRAMRAGYASGNFIYGLLVAKRI